MKSDSSLPISVEVLIERFPYERVFAAMSILHWKWLGTGGTPTVGDMKDMVRVLFRTLIQDKFTRNTQCGGFRVSRHTDGETGERVYEIEFIAASLGSDAISIKE